MKKRADRLEFYIENAVFAMITSEPKNRMTLLREVENSSLDVTKYQVLNLLRKWLKSGEIKSTTSFVDGRRVYYYNPSNKKAGFLGVTGVEL